MKIKTIKTFKWIMEMPEFKDGNIYDLSENLALEMIKHGYAINVENNIMTNEEIENKMIDISSKSKRGRKRKIDVTN